MLITSYNEQLKKYLVGLQLILLVLSYVKLLLGVYWSIGKGCHSFAHGWQKLKSGRKKGCSWKMSFLQSLFIAVHGIA